MRSATRKLLVVLREETERTREELAAQEFKLEDVRLKVTRAAQSGLWRIRLRPAAYLEDVRNTRAAKALDEWTQREGLTVLWEKRWVDLPEGLRIEVFEPEISWQARKS